MTNTPVSTSQQLLDLRDNLAQLPLPQQRVVVKVKQSINVIVNSTEPIGLGELALTLCILERLVQQQQRESDHVTIIDDPRNH